MGAAENMKRRARAGLLAAWIGLAPLVISALGLACGQTATEPTQPSATAPPSSPPPVASATPPPPSPTPPVPPGPDPSQPTPVHVVLFTHIEDNTPAGPLDAPQARTSYLNLRARLIAMGELARRLAVPWSLEPDWKFLLAAQSFEDADRMASTGGVNVLRHLRDTLGVIIDPHSHESGGYNYTDVAHLLSSLGVGGSTVIGGHIWDPALPQFQQWDRFRAPVSGLRYPTATWRGDILMGSGTPNHVNDPVVSGVWRPRDRDNYFEDDPLGNIACVGAFTHDLAGVSDLVERYRTGEVASSCMLTTSYHIRPADLLAPSGLASIESTVLQPLVTLRGSGKIALTDFTGLVSTWKQRFGAKACQYMPKK